MKKIQVRPKAVYKRFEKSLLTWNIKKVIGWLCFFGVLFALAGTYLWYSRMYMNDERRFWIALDNSMATPSVTRTLTNGGSGNRVVQEQQFFFAPQAATHSHVSYVQKTSTVDTAVETEGIAFLDAQYSRYIAFHTNQTRPDGTTPDLSKILGKWEGTEIDAAGAEESKQNFVGELVTLAVFGNYSSEFRSEVLDAFKSAETYKIEPSNTQDDIVNGRNVKLISARINLHSYAEQLQKAFLRAGFGEFAPLDPANYQPDASVSAKFAVDVQNNSLIGISFGTREEQYSGYGITQTLAVPHTDFSSGELESAVQNEIQGAL